MIRLVASFGAAAAIIRSGGVFLARRLACLVLGAFALVTVQLAAPWAQASGPKFHKSAFRFTGRVDCGSFSDRFVDRYRIAGGTFFDGGKAVRTIDHVRHTSTDRNSVTGAVVHQHDRYNIVTNLRTGIMRVSGGLFRINRPGKGMVIHDVGRVVMDGQQHLKFTAGRHDVLGKDSTVFCKALA
jgi:hypothetical protein